MVAGGVNKMGRFNVEFQVANNDDLALVRRGMLPLDQVRRQTVSGVVDSGAVQRNDRDAVLVDVHQYRFVAHRLFMPTCETRRNAGRRSAH